MSTYYYAVVKQENPPSAPESGQIWIKVDSDGNDIQAYIYIGGVWVPFG